MPDEVSKGLLTDIGTEELAHLEMIGSILYQLTRNLTPAEIKAGGFDKYFVGHGDGIYPCAASGEPFTAASIQSKGDALCDLNEDLAADVTILKEQPLSKNRRKPLKYKNNSKENEDI